MRILGLLESELGEHVREVRLDGPVGHQQPDAMARFDRLFAASARTSRSRAVRLANESRDSLRIRTSVLLCFLRMSRPRDQRPYNVAYYARNREREILRVRQRQDARLAYLRGLRRRPCADCGGTFEPHQMDFDHRDPANKSFRLTSSRAMLASEATLRQELEKCDVVCANCHRVRTMRTAPNQHPNRTAVRSKATQRWSINRRAQLMVLAELRDSPCRDCGRRLPWYAMEYDHRDPKAKVDEVMRMAGHAGLDRILAEVAKCDIVCSNCHRDRTHRRRGAATSERE